MIGLAANHKKYGITGMETVSGWFRREKGLKAKN
jgi:hypothetical protein